MSMSEVSARLALGYKIRNLQVTPGLVLAPMSGVTSSAFRRLIKELNPGAVGLTVSEFISVEGLTRSSQRSKDMMRFREVERPFGIQIFGYDINRMRDAALMAQDMGADLVDINCGCPAPKVVKRGGGCELMRQPEHLRQLVREVRRGLNVPLTLKMRSGWEDLNRNCLEIAKIVVGEGVEGLAVHGRTRTQLYRGQADWDVVDAVAREVSVPVCGSGDVLCRETALARLKPSIAGILIGRGALANPWVFSEILCGQTGLHLKDPLNPLRVLLRYLELLREDLPEKAIIGRLKQLASQMGRGFPWRKDFCQAMSVGVQEEIIRRSLENLQGRANPVESETGLSELCA